MINTEIIKAMNPCKDRLDNYLDYYKDFSGSLEEFFKLDKITHQDKLWVSLRLLSKTQAIESACQFAESTLYIFEEKYPQDKRPRLAIEATRLFTKGEITLSELREARNAAYASAAATDAAAASDAAAYAAYAAASAYAASATYAAYVAADAAYAAASAYAAYAAAARKKEQDKQLNIILNVYNSI